MFVPKVVYHSKIKQRKARSRKDNINKFVKKRASNQQQQEASGSLMLDSASETMSSIDEGLAVVDTSAMRETLKAEHHKLLNRVAELEKQNAELEALVWKNGQSSNRRNHDKNTEQAARSSPEMAITHPTLDTNGAGGSAPNAAILSMDGQVRIMPNAQDN